jgi:hypothetical protein
VVKGATATGMAATVEEAEEDVEVHAGEIVEMANKADLLAEKRAVQEA